MPIVHAAILSDIRCAGCGKLLLKLKYGCVQVKCRSCKALFLVTKNGEEVTMTSNVI